MLPLIILLLKPQLYIHVDTADLMDTDRHHGYIKA